MAETTAAPPAETAPAETTTPAPEAAKPAPPPPVKVKLKQGDKEIEEEVPLDKLVEVYRNAEPMRRTAYQRFEEAKKQRDEAARLVGTLKKDTRAALKEAGIDPLEWAEQVIAEHLQQEQMSPEQKEAAALRRELEGFKAKEEEAKKAAEERAAKEAEAKELDRISDLILETCKVEGMPALQKGARGALVVKQLAHLLEAAEERGLELTPQELAQAYKEAVSTDFLGGLQGLQGAALLAAIPPDLRKAIRAAELAAATGKAPAAADPADGLRSEQSRRRKPMTAKELAEYHAKLLEDKQ